MRIEKCSTDEELLRQIKNNDSGALKVLFEKYFSQLCYFSKQFVKNTDLAEEAVSDIFLNIWLKRGKIEITTSLRAYLYTAVRNQSLNYLKQNKIHFEEMEIAETEGKMSESDADRLVNFEELKNEIDIILRQLPKKREIVFRMNRIEGLSYKEIAEILSISVNTVQNQMVKAVKFISGQYPHLKKLFFLLSFLIIR